MFLFYFIFWFKHIETSYYIIYYNYVLYGLSGTAKLCLVNIDRDDCFFYLKRHKKNIENIRVFITNIFTYRQLYFSYRFYNKYFLSFNLNIFYTLIIMIHTFCESSQYQTIQMYSEMVFWEFTKLEFLKFNFF